MPPAFSHRASEVHEEQRLAALHRLDLLDTLEEEDFTELARLAADICASPMALISLVDRHRLWLKAAIGLDGGECGRDGSFCSYAIEKPGLFLVPDATKDVRFAQNPMVLADPNIRFYAAVPLLASGNFPVGVLCVLDSVVRRLSAPQKRALALLGRQVEMHMRLRIRQKSIEVAMAARQRRVTELERNEDLFRAFVDHGPSANYIKDADGRMVFYNQQLARTFNVSEHAWIGKTDAEIWPPEMAAQFRANDLQVLESGNVADLTETSHTDGITRHWKSCKFPFRRANGELVLAGMSVDVTAEIEREERLSRALKEKSELAGSLKASETLFHSFMDKTPNLSFVKDDQGRYLFYNLAFAAQYGINQTESLGKTVHDVLPEKIAKIFHENDLRLLASGDLQEDVSEIANAAGEIVIFRWLKFVIQDGTGRNTIAGVAIDITAESRRQQALAEANVRLEHLATTDALTGLHNRAFFESRITIEFAVSARKRRPLAVVMMDIDNFKRRNDQFGHAAGDEAIRLLGKVLLQNVRLGDLAARIGGEEFCCMLPDTGPDEAKLFAERIQTQLRALDPGPLPLTVSIGVVASNRTTGTWERMVSQADDAMYEAKRTGKDKVVVHSEHIRQLMKEMERPAARPPAAPVPPPEPRLPAAPQVQASRTLPLLPPVERAAPAAITPARPIGPTPVPAPRRRDHTARLRPTTPKARDLVH